MTVVLSVEFSDSRQHPFRVIIDDPAGSVVAARIAGIIDFQTAVDHHVDADAGAVNITEREIAVLWVGSFCDVSATLVVRPARFLMQPDPRPACDASAIDRGIVLSMRDPLDASGVAVSLGHQTLLP